MKIGFVSQWYDPEQGSAALPGVISRAIARQGHEVHVLTGFPNYPAGRLYPGYSVKPYQFETGSGGVHVHRSPLWVNHDARALRRAGNYLSFALASSAVALSRLPRLDAVWVHSTPATAAIPALALKRVRKTPFVAHIQDLWPETVTASGFLASHRAGRAEQWLHRYCDHVYDKASAVAVSAPGMLPRLIERGVSETRLSYLPNWADERAFRPVEDRAAAKRSLGLRAAFTVMYAGNFGEFQALDTFVGAAKLLRDRCEIEFVLVGGGVEEARLRRMVSDWGLSNVRFVGPQPFDSMAQVLAAGDVQVISLRDRPLSRMTLPSKIQATLAAGRPVIGALSGDAAHVIAESGAGEIVEPGSSEALAVAVAGLASRPPETLDALGAAARTYYEVNFAEQRMMLRMVGLLECAAQEVAR